MHVSGVLAVAVAGLMVGHDTPRFTTGASRLQASAVWRLVDFLLQGFVFLLIGQQILPVVRGLKAYPASTIAGAVILTLGVVLLLRPLWLLLTQSLPGALHTRLGGAARRAGSRRLRSREIVVLSWAGTRGVISLAAIFTLPLTTSAGQPLPRPGSAAVLHLRRRRGDPGRPGGDVRADRPGAGRACRPGGRARRCATRPAPRPRRRDCPGWTRSPRSSRSPASALAGLRASLEGQLRRYQQAGHRTAPGRGGRRRTDGTDGGIRRRPPGRIRRRRWTPAGPSSTPQREELLRWRDACRLPDASLRILNRELDHEERTVPGPDGH